MIYSFNKVNSYNFSFRIYPSKRDSLYLINFRIITEKKKTHDILYNFIFPIKQVKILRKHFITEYYAEII